MYIKLIFSKFRYKTMDSKKQFDPAEAAEALIAAHDGDMALLYIYTGLRGYDPDNAARELCRTKEQIENAREKLENAGLFSPRANVPGTGRAIKEVQKLPVYTADEITGREKGDPTFRDLISEAGQILGHQLSSSEMIKIYGIYDHLALSPDVIIFMMHYCKEEIDRKYKGSRSPFIRYLENEALEWYEEGIRDYDAAEKYVAEKRRKREKSEQYKKIFGISGRDYSPGEKKYAEAWAGMGFEDEAVSRAFDITVLNTGKLAWKYMDTILRNWHAKGLHTAAEIEAAEPSRKVTRPPQQGGSYTALSPREREQLKNRHRRQEE